MSKVWLLRLLLRPLRNLDDPGFPCPSRLDLFLFSPQPWHDRLWHLVLPPLRMAWGAVRGGGSAAQAKRNGASPRKGWEGGCRSRRRERRLRCLLLCSVSSGKCRLINEVFFAPRVHAQSSLVVCHTVRWCIRKLFLPEIQTIPKSLRHCFSRYPSISSEGTEHI